MSNLNSEDFNAMKEAGFINEWKNGIFFKRFRENGQRGCQARSLIF